MGAVRLDLHCQNVLWMGLVGLDAHVFVTWALTRLCDIGGDQLCAGTIIATRLIDFGVVGVDVATGRTVVLGERGDSVAGTCDDIQGAVIRGDAANLLVGVLGLRGASDGCRIDVMREGCGLGYARESVLGACVEVLPGTGI